MCKCPVAIYAPDLLEMDRYVKRTATNADSSSNSKSKRRRLDPEENINWGRNDPGSICVWNCNGLPVRLKSSKDRSDLVNFMRDVKPDVMCFSEVRCAAFCADKSAKRNDGRVRDRTKFNCVTSEGARDKELFDTFLSEPELACYVPYISLADWKYAGTLVLVNSARVMKPKAVRYNIDLDADPTQHDPNGRVIMLCFEQFSILHTYSPNNGWIQNDFTRRKKWDEQMKKFVLSCNESKNVVVWAGDLNVAPMDCDLSHPEYFRRQVRRTQPGQPRESSPSVENIGQPGCTSAERERLIEILRVGGLADLYRCKKAPKNGHDSLESAFSWRGSSDGKYYGKGMRIDHFFGSASLIASVESVANLGRGMDRKGFLGSDHCPVLLTFKPGHSK